MPNRGKGEFVKEVVNNVLTELKTAYLEVSNCLVEVDNHVDEIMRIIGTHNRQTKIVGIHGMGGVGKTTVAKIVYNQLSNDYVHCCFLSNIRKIEITRLQNQLISNILKTKWPNINTIMEGKKVIQERLCSKKVLLLLDDVDKASQLDALVDNRDCFGNGSKIIITTRDRGILKAPTLVDGTYELTGMDLDHSLQLFSKHAFRRDYPLKEYIFHSARAINICDGLPLALEIIGSLLSGKRVEEWDATLRELEESPQEDVGNKLMICIEALNEDQIKIFLDVACFFIGYDKRIVIHMWESCKFLPHQSLGVLQQRSLIKIRDYNQLWMHDWLRDIGRNFVQKGSGEKPEKQQWVWTHAQALEVLEKMKIGGDVPGIESIEMIHLKLENLSQYSSIKEYLASLLNLRFLQVDSEDFGNTKSILTQLGRLIYYRWSNFLETPYSPLILPELRWLHWHYFPMDFKLTKISLRKLVPLDLSKSKITEKWDGWSHIKLAQNLKVLNLIECNEIRRTPDLSFHVNLERLILERCESLVQIDPSISHLKKLVFLNLKYCKGLRELPDEMGELESLKELLDKTSIEEIPEWRRMKKLEILSLVECESLNKFSFIGCAASTSKLSSVGDPSAQLPKSIENSNSLIELDLSGTKLKELPDSTGNMKNLKVLTMLNSSVRKLPSAIGMLEKLEMLQAGASFLRLGGSNIGKRPYLIISEIYDTEISAVPWLPESLITLSIATVSMETFPNLSNLLNLRTLCLCLWGIFEDPIKLQEAPSLWWVGRLRALEVLVLWSPYIATLSSDLVLLSQLKQLNLLCRNLQCLPRLPTNLSYLCIKFCKRIKTTNDLSTLKLLSNLEVTHCEKLTEIHGLECLENLRTLELMKLPSLTRLPDLTTLKKLKKIHLGSCTELFEIRGSPESLEMLDIWDCSKLQKLPDPSSFKNVKSWIQNGTRMI